MGIKPISPLQLWSAASLHKKGTSNSAYKP